MISKESLQIIEASPGWRAHRVEIFDLPEGKMLVKGQRALRSPWPHRVLSSLAWLARVPYLRAVPVHGGAQSQAIEIARLTALRQAGVRVPQVHHVDKDYFVMAYLGSDDLAKILNQDKTTAFRQWLLAMDLLLDVHARGQYLSQCFGRNIIVSEAGGGFIDFEDDPLEVMNLVEAQAHDWLIYLQSTLWTLGADERAVDDALQAAFARESGPVRAVLLHASFRLGWLRCLPTQRKPWGRDVVNLQATAAALHRYYKKHQHSPRPVSS